MLTEKKVKNILKLFEENDEPKNGENFGNVEDQVDFVVLEKPEDDPLAVRVKDEDEKTTEEKSKLKKKLKKPTVKRLLTQLDMKMMDTLEHPRHARC